MDEHGIRENGGAGNGRCARHRVIMPRIPARRSAAGPPLLPHGPGWAHAERAGGSLEGLLQIVLCKDPCSGRTQLQRRNCRLLLCQGVLPEATLDSANRLSNERAELIPRAARLHAGSQIIHLHPASQIIRGADANRPCAARGTSAAQPPAEQSACRAAHRLCAARGTHVGSKLHESTRLCALADCSCVQGVLPEVTLEPVGC